MSNPFATYFKPVKSSSLPCPREVIDAKHGPVYKLIFVYNNETQAEIARQHILNEDLYIAENIIYCLQEEDVKICCFDGYFNAIEISLKRGDIK